MPLYMDIHHKVDGLTADAVMHAHEAGVQTQDKYDVQYLKYWFDEGSGKVFCLVQAPARRRLQQSIAKPMALKPMKSSRFRKASNPHNGEVALRNLSQLFVCPLFGVARWLTSAILL